MKKITYLLLIIFLIPFDSFAQDGYTFTLSDNGNYSYTISAVSNFDTGSFEPITESYGFVIVLPDGITATFTEYLPAGTNGTTTFIDGVNVVGLDPNMADNDLYLITTITNAAKFVAHTNGTIIPLVTLTVNGNPTFGEIRLLSNDSDLANNIGASLDNFLQVDIIDDGSFAFENSVVGISGLSGTVYYDFSTLSISEDNFTKTLLYPNPTSSFINISSTQEVLKIELFDILGKLVLSKTSTNKIDVSKYKSGIYLIKIYTQKGNIVKKIVVE